MRDPAAPPFPSPKGRIGMSRLPDHVRNPVSPPRGPTPVWEVWAAWGFVLGAPTALGLLVWWALA